MIFHSDFIFTTNHTVIQTHTNYFVTKSCISIVLPIVLPISLSHLKITQHTNNQLLIKTKYHIEHLGKEEVSGSNPDISSEVAVNELTAFLFYIIIVQIVPPNKSLPYSTL